MTSRQLTLGGRVQKHALPIPGPLSPPWRAAAEYRPGELAGAPASLRQLLGRPGPTAPEPRTHPAQLLQKPPRATRRRPGPRHLRAHGRRPRSRPAGQQQARRDRGSAGKANAVEAGAHHCGPAGGARVAPPPARPWSRPARRRRPLVYGRSSAATSALDLKGPARRSQASNLGARGAGACGCRLPPRDLRLSPGVEKKKIPPPSPELPARPRPRADVKSV